MTKQRALTLDEALEAKANIEHLLTIQAPDTLEPLREALARAEAVIAKAEAKAAPAEA
jgi:hypothetical protein